MSLVPPCLAWMKTVPLNVSSRSWTPNPNTRTSFSQSIWVIPVFLFRKAPMMSMSRAISPLTKPAASFASMPSGTPRLMSRQGFPWNSPPEPIIPVPAPIRPNSSLAVRLMCSSHPPMSKTAHPPSISTESDPSAFVSRRISSALPGARSSDSGISFKSVSVQNTEVLGFPLRFRW